MKKVFGPFVSLDIETTGLKDINPYIIEIGAHFEDFGYFNKRDSKLNTFAVKVDNGVLDEKRCGEFAMNLNKDLLDMIKNKDESDGIKILSLLEAKKQLHDWLQGIFELVKKESIFGGKSDYFKLTPAGKNFGGFDAVIFDQNNFELDKFLGHRVLDPGPLYYLDFGYVPNLNQIQKLNNMSQINHRALDDAKAVSSAISLKVNGIL